jgi:hypothetical protein
MSFESNFIIDKNTIRKVDLFRITYFITFISAFLITETGRFLYRPFIYDHNINDFGLADAMGNLGGVIVQIYLGLAILNPPFKKALRVIALFVIGYILYEFAQPYLPKGVFDWKDVYGTLIGGFIALIWLFIIPLIIKPNKVVFTF